jgi:MYXO-CTERM domain-containing protein
VRPRYALACALFASLTLASASGAAQSNGVRPYFLVIVDTSGSMQVSNSAPANSCGFGGGNSATGNPTKLDAAKCALTKIIQATGDADFGLMQFADPSNNCTGPSSCGPTDAAGWLRAPIQSNNSQPILSLLDKQGSSTTSATNELCANGYTPLGGVLIAAKEYFEGNLSGFAAPTAGDTGLACRPLSVILLTDGDECCNSCNNAWSGCPKTHAAFPSISCPTTCGTSASCTNANEAYENAPDRAYELLHGSMAAPNDTGALVPSASGAVHKPIPTYAIGFGISGPDAHIEHIATAGGTDNPGDGAGGERGFYASNESQLSLALSQIIADAQPPAEICNGLDDDCDMLIDEGIPKFCDLPNGMPDRTLCTSPPETVCDGKDDNCNGLIDEGLLNACKKCGDVPPELCDGLDNDCDGHIDEEIPSGASCGNDVGSCKAGMLQCISGSNQCQGEVGPQPETCNCKDDDCDGTVDEDVGNSLCPDGKCVGCECVPHCGMNTEFVASCPDGLRPDFQPSGECLCIKDDCDVKTCRQSTLMRDDQVACAPSDRSVAPCFCVAGACVARCDGVTCGAGKTCNKHDGRCVTNDCTGLGCAADELCDALAGQCVKDACATAGCSSSEVCRGGKCERSCAAVTCADAERCEAGKCVPDKCASATCDMGAVCDRTSGKCVDNACGSRSCGAGQVCVPSSGDCERDPCWDVHCPAKQVCSSGQCLPPSTGAGFGGKGGVDGNARVLAAGGGGCSCRVAAGSGSRTAKPWLAALALCLLGLGRSRRRRRQPPRGLPVSLLVLALCVATLSLAGCKVDPFCIDCVDAGKPKPKPDSGIPGAPDGSASGEGGTNIDAGEDAGFDSGTHQPRCTPKTELCNGKDDDCDFKVDEDTVPDVNDCDQFGVCAGTVPICVNGQFACRYPDAREKDETRCDGIDSDCDGHVDETFTTLGDTCMDGVGACQVAGQLVCNSTGDGVSCEIAHKIDPVDEVCDGIDNDCDGLVDEPRNDPGTSPSFVQDDVVQVGASLWVYKYEASRQDASDTEQGIIGKRACSRAGVLPWTSATYPEALDACDKAGMELCKLADWVTACQGGGTCAMSYTPTGGSCLTDVNAYPTNGSACNGHDLTAQPGGADRDALAPTGSKARCFVNVQGGEVFDLSGNAKEWTVGPNSPGENPLRGGSYNNLPAGMTCSFDFAVASDKVRLPNVGFRCCSTSQP